MILCYFIFPNVDHTMWVFVFHKYGNFWSISQGQFIKHKLLFSVEWSTNCFDQEKKPSKVFGLGKKACLLKYSRGTGQFFSDAIWQKNFMRDACVVRVGKENTR